MPGGAFRSISLSVRIFITGADCSALLWSMNGAEEDDDENTMPRGTETGALITLRASE